MKLSQWIIQCPCANLPGSLYYMNQFPNLSELAVCPACAANGYHVELPLRRAINCCLDGFNEEWKDRQKIADWVIGLGLDQEEVKEVHVENLVIEEMPVIPVEELEKQFKEITGEAIERVLNHPGDTAAMRMSLIDDLTDRFTFDPNVEVPPFYPKQMFGSEDDPTSEWTIVASD